MLPRAGVKLDSLKTRHGRETASEFRVARLAERQLSLPGAEYAASVLLAIEKGGLTFEWLT